MISDQNIAAIVSAVMMRSCMLQAGQRVLIEAVDVPAEAVRRFVRETRALGIKPFVRFKSESLIREFMCCYGAEDFKLLADDEIAHLEHMDALVLVRAPQVSGGALSSLGEGLQLALEHYVRRVHFEYRNRRMRFVALRWPSDAMVSRAAMSAEEFDDYYVRAVLADYSTLSRTVVPLLSLMERTEVIRILGPGETDLEFSTRGMPVTIDAGQKNLPDGELSTAPISTSLNGRIHYNIPAHFYGEDLRDIVLVFDRGRVVDSSCRNRAALREMDRQVGPLEIDGDGLARRGLIVRHLVLPRGVAGTPACLRFVAQHLRPGVAVSLMAQYAPAHRAAGHAIVGRRLTEREYDRACAILADLDLEHGWVQSLTESPDHYRPDFRQEHPFEHRSEPG